LVTRPALGNHLTGDSAAARALQQAALLQLDQVAPDGDGRGLETLCQGIDFDDAAALDEGDDFLVACIDSG
ncbi:hypothetical protein, partial [Acinetobacter nosocomialis]